MANHAPTGTASESGPVIFCDFDGTITQLDVTDQILAQLAHPSWREVEQEWVRGLIGSRECLERQMALVETSAKELNALIDGIPIDPHFAKFYRFTRKRGLPFYVMSDAFDYIIRRVLKRSGVDGQLRNGTHIFASVLRLAERRLLTSFPYAGPPCEHGCATCKAAILREVGRGRRPLIFIGDGLSDRFGAKVADVVFAKHQLLAYCREQGIGCQPYETFAEVQEWLRRRVELVALEGGAGGSRKSKVKSRKSETLALNFQLSGLK